MPIFSEQQASRALQLGSSTLFEASGLNCALDPEIRNIWRGMTVAAPAYPLACSPGDNLGIHLALEKVPKGSVLVVSTQNFLAGYWGEVLTVAAQAAGVKGLIIDGGVRDITATLHRHFPVFARGVAVRGTIKASYQSIGEPLMFSGVPVATDDLVVADDDGVVIIPATEVSRVLAEAEQREEKERAMMQKLEAGSTTVELMGLSHWRDK
ncbi:RraA family protein [Pantoea cypripedii]|uniref:Dimethylmenaquinone methyltransferase n=1 Tax=Pantoea cypripedii TaxID=55209 RepID=A0A1X1EM87_PANCY|nr:dimethylmenaquinone methyltransferase [Pantoea cypripedii]MBP2199161.1 4-hydroxy-4-methyl-2-oxoglutarate aldolase [Pantoea cypripedii]ORM90009.1 dimethylmenaquinone methyltransferase [Pantoea cypripedii]